MHGIGQLVCLGAHERRLALVGCKVKHVRCYARKLLREQLHELWVHKVKERFAPADDVFKEAGLRFMYAHACACAERGAKQIIPGVKLVKRMTAFMHNAVKA